MTITRVTWPTFTSTKIIDQSTVYILLQLAMAHHIAFSKWNYDYTTPPTLQLGKVLFALKNKTKDDLRNTIALKCWIPFNQKWDGCKHYERNFSLWYIQTRRVNFTSIVSHLSSLSSQLNSMWPRVMGDDHLVVEHNPSGYRYQQNKNNK